MAKRKDPVETARSIFDEFLSISDPDSVPAKKESPEPKDPKKQAAGRLGGKKGGLARAKKLSSSRRETIARAAAKSRWEKTKP